MSHSAIAAEAAAGLHDEGRLLSRYLLGSEAAPDVLERYVRGVVQLDLLPRSRSDAALLAFVRRHPSCLPLLDAGVAAVGRESVLRGRLLLMLALCEATPELAEAFLPRPRHRVAALARVALLGAVGACKGVAGRLLLPFAARGR